MLGAGTRFVDRKGTAFKIFAVKGRDCGLRFGVRGHFDKRETPRPARKFIFNDRYRCYLSMSFEQRANITFNRVK